MTNRERFHKLMNFEKVDRLPMLEWASWWDLTINNWVEQGLKIPEKTDGLPPLQELKKQLGLDLDLQTWIGCTTAQTPKPAYHGAPIVESMEDYERILPTLYPEHPVNEPLLREFAQEPGHWRSHRMAFFGRHILGARASCWALNPICTPFMTNPSSCTASTRICAPITSGSSSRSARL